MPQLHRSQGSHEESRRTKGAGERVWMEELEGRLLLTRADWLDLSHVEWRSGGGNPSFKFEAQAQEQYLFVEFDRCGSLDLTDADGNEVDWSEENDACVSRLSWRAPKAGTYTLWVDDGDEDTDYRLMARVAKDDFGNNRLNATTLREGRTISGEIEDIDDRDIFTFEANAGERWAFDLNSDNSDLEPIILNERAHEVLGGHDGSEPMPYTGTYYVVLSGDGWDVGKYQLSARRVIDSEGDTPAPLTLGASTPGLTDYYEDYDWFSFEARAGVRYIFNLRSQTNKWMTLWTGADDECYSCQLNGSDGRLPWTAPTDGIYYLLVTGSAGPYTLNSGTEKAADRESASALEAGTPAAGAIAAPGAGQYFVIHTNARYTYTLRTQASSFADGLLVDLIQGEGGTRDDPESGSIRIGAGATSQSWTWTPLHDVTYYLLVRSYDPIDSGAFELNLSEEADDFGNSAAEATPIELGTAHDGKIQYDRDDDWFSINVTEGEKYVFNLDSFGDYLMATMYRRRKGYNPRDISLTLFDDAGNQLAYRSNYTKFDLKFEWTATFTGPVYARVSARGDTPRYTLLAARQEDDPQKPQALAIGETAGGSLAEGGDVARFRVVLEPGKAYATNLDAVYAQFAMLPADGRYIENDCVDGCQHIIWRIEQPTEFFVEVDANAATNYSMQVSEYIPPPPPPPPPPVQEQPPVEEDPPALPQPDQPRSELPWELADADDVRAFLFTAQAGRRYVFQTILGTLGDSTLTIYDADGRDIHENDDVSDDDLSSDLEWTAHKDGTYFIVVGGFGGGSFDLSASEGRGAQRKDLKLEPMAVADARTKFGYDSAADEGEDGEDSSGDGWLSSDDDELDFSDDWDWGNL